MTTFGSVSYNPFATNPLLRLVANWRHTPAIIQKPEWAPDQPGPGDGMKLWMISTAEPIEAIAIKLESDIYDLHLEGDKYVGLTPGHVLITEPVKLTVSGTVCWCVYIGTRDE